MQFLSFPGIGEGSLTIAGRTVLISLFVWGLLLYQFYSASVVGSLLAEAPRYITTMKDLMNSNIDVYYEDIAYHYDYFRVSKIE